MLLVIEVTGYPNPARNPAVSTAIYPPPTTSVLPGGLFNEKISSEVIATSLRHSNIEGLPPVPITAYLNLSDLTSSLINFSFSNDSLSNY